MKVSLTIWFVLIFLLISACSNHREQKPLTQKIRVKTAPVARKTIAPPLHASGILALKDEIKLAFKTGGIIKRIFVDEGQKVKKGALLARLDLAEIEARKNQAQSAYRKAERDFKRVSRLYADSVVTFEQLQNAQTALDVAGSNLRIAEFNLKHSAIYAPSNGKIYKKLFNEGEMVNPGMPVLIFGNEASGWIIKTGLADRDILQIQLGDSARIQFDPYPNQYFSAVVSEVAAVASPKTGLYEVEIRLINPSRPLLSGFVGRIEIFPSKGETVWMIPVEALLEGKGMTGKVYAPAEDEKSVRLIEVQIAYILDGRVAVRTGLEKISRVITDGVSYLDKNSTIEIIR